MKTRIELLAALAFVAATTAIPAVAQGSAPEGVVMKKYVEEGSTPGRYTLNLETYVTGESVTTEAGAPVDVILVLDFSSSLYSASNKYKTTSKFHKLRMAAVDFIRNMQQYKTEYDADARIGVVCFSDWNSNPSKNRTIGLTDGFVDPLSDEVSTLISHLSDDRYSADTWSGNSTRIDKGLEIAGQWLDAEPAGAAARYVIVFTDGEPTGGSNPLSDARNALAEAYDIKQMGVSVYTIGLLTESQEKKRMSYQGTEVTSWSTTNPSGSPLTMKSFLQRLSSHYPGATITSCSYNQYTYTANYSNWNSPSDFSQDYYQRADESTLESIFSSISEKVTGGASYKLDATATTVIDVVGDSFRLPEGADGSSIHLQVAPCTGMQPDGTFLFGTPEDAGIRFPGITAKVGTMRNHVFTEEAGGKAVQVSNYDFSANWVGENSTGATVVYHGYKLIISFDIEIDPANPGGATENTNTADSGIYYDADGDGSGEQVGAYEIPEVKIPNLVIIKRGLKKGDSAVFRVYQVGAPGTPPMELVVTQGDGEYAVVCVKLQRPGRYTVEECEWSWAYGAGGCRSVYVRDDSSVTEAQWNAAGFGSGYGYQIPEVTGTVVSQRSITRNLNDFTEEQLQGGYKGTLFEFTNEPLTGIPPHAESFKNNIFSTPGN